MIILDDVNTMILVSRTIGLIALIFGCIYIFSLMHKNYVKGYKEGYKDKSKNEPNKYEFE